jgi:hypothetical protein
MIHMRMRQQHRIHIRQILHPHARPPLSPQQNQPRSKHRINQHRQPLHLHQKRRVPNERHRLLFDTHRRWLARLTLQRLCMTLADQPPKLLQLLPPKRHKNS